MTNRLQFDERDTRNKMLALLYNLKYFIMEDKE